MSLEENIVPLARDSVDTIDTLRSSLEMNVTILQESLRLWQTCEAEYEGLKEEMLNMREDASEEELLALARDYGGTLVDEKQMKDLFQGPGNGRRSLRQIVDVVSRRIEYVSRNAQSAQKELQAAEAKLNSASSSISPEAPVANGQPVIEIREELDEEGNVISGTISNSGSKAPASLQDLGTPKEADARGTTTEKEFKSAMKATKSQVTREDEQKAASKQAAQPVMGSPERGTEKKAKPVKKGVRFTADTKSMDASRPKAKRKNRFLVGHGSIASGRSRYQRIAVNKQEEGLIDPVVPVSESPEDASLRREMLQYGLSEVGAIVAELSIDEGGVEVEVSEDDDNELLDGSVDEEEEEEEEEEDKYGRSTKRVVDDEYVKEMKALQRKMEGERGRKNDVQMDLVPSGKPLRPTEKKADRPPPTPSKNPISDVIVEHSLPPSSSSSLGDHSSYATEPDEADDDDDDENNIDPILHRQEIAMEYHKMRNRMIHQQGGFLGDDDDAEEEKVRMVPLSPEEGGPKKVSRFKAARLRRS